MLSGIENNNGWIKIESEEDLPKERGRYFIVDKFNQVGVTFWEEGAGEFWLEGLTYYQPVILPKKPVY